MEEKEYIHWKQMFDKNYLGSWSLAPGEEKVLTIKGFKREKVTAQGGSSEIRCVVYFEEDGVLPMVLNSTNCKTIEKIYKTPNVIEWVGKKIQVYATTTKFGRDSQVPCLRIRDFAPKTDKVEYKCCVCGKEITQAYHDASIKKYGKPYCSEECKNQDINGSDIL